MGGEERGYGARGFRDEVDGGGDERRKVTKGDGGGRGEGEGGAGTGQRGDEFAPRV